MSHTATPAHQPPWLRRAEAARILGVATRTVSRWINQGVIPRNALKLTGRQHRISAKWCQGAA